MNINTIHFIAKALNTSVDFLVFGTVENKSFIIIVLEDMFNQLTSEEQKSHRLYQLFITYL